MLKAKWFRCLTLFVALLLLLTSVGCNTPQTPTPTEPPVTPPATPPEEPTVLHPDLIDSMVEYLQQLTAQYDMPTYGFDDKITFILNGKRAFHVKFNSSDYYYACAFYNPSHTEPRRYCCAENYTWVGFENEADILETYNGEQLIVVLQINKAVVCQDILQDTWDGSTMEQYQLYTPKFENGKNVASAVEFDGEFIFLSDSERLNLYCCEDYYFFRNVTLPCVELDGTCYLKYELYSEFPNGARDESDLQSDFGVYYDDLMEIMIADRYSVTQTTGEIDYYGLFELGEFADFLRSRIVQTE